MNYKWLPPHRNCCPTANHRSLITIYSSKDMIEVKNLTYGYADKAVLKQLNCTIEEGSFYALMGANGCGKTTLLRLLSGLAKPQQGSVCLKGRPVDQYSAREMARHMSLVRQQAQTDFEFTAFESVLMGRNPYQRRLQNESKRDWEIVEDCMKRTNTWHLRYAKPGEMSGGELQRVMLARALAQQTPIMLLDEPISNLDIAHQFEIMELLRQINQQEHITLILVIHDLNMAWQYCNQLILLHQGGILYQGSMKQGLTSQNISRVFGVDSRIEGDHLVLSKNPTGKLN